MPPEVVALFRKSRVQLQALFHAYASPSENVVSLEQFGSLCSDFDLVPTFLNYDSMLKCFEKTTTMNYVTYSQFTTALFEIAELSLSKAAFQELYPTSEFRVSFYFFSCIFLMFSKKKTSIPFFPGHSDVKFVGSGRQQPVDANHLGKKVLKVLNFSE